MSTFVPVIMPKNLFKFEDFNNFISNVAFIKQLKFYKHLCFIEVCTIHT